MLIGHPAIAENFVKFVKVISHEEIEENTLHCSRLREMDAVVAPSSEST